MIIVLWTPRLYRIRPTLHNHCQVPAALAKVIVRAQQIRNFRGELRDGSPTLGDHLVRTGAIRGLRQTIEVPTSTTRDSWHMTLLSFQDRLLSPAMILEALC